MALQGHHARRRCLTVLEIGRLRCLETVTRQLLSDRPSLESLQLLSFARHLGPQIARICKVLTQDSASSKALSRLSSRSGSERAAASYW